MTFSIKLGLALAAVVAVLILTTFQYPPVSTKQLGYRGLGLEQVQNVRAARTVAAHNVVPEAQPPAEPGGTLATTEYKNVQVLKDLNVEQFNRLMAAMTEWVSPDQGCTYCHAEGEELSSDKLYTKVVARRMLQMTREINSNWKAHVAETGVTCYTCHRGAPLPAQTWHAGAVIGKELVAPGMERGLDRGRAGQNAPAASAGLSSLPFDPFTPFLLDSKSIRVQSASALPTGSNPKTIKDTEWTYSFMTHVSEALGVGCTYCHNSRSWTAWETSTPARVTAWHAIGQVRGLNNTYIAPLATTIPAEHKGPLGDSLKVNCATCHQGVFKPLYGVSMLKDYPELAPARR
jgi:photosynthetic reaction center cytochrome c subunit